MRDAGPSARRNTSKKLAKNVVKYLEQCDVKFDEIDNYFMLKKAGAPMNSD